MIKLLVKVSVLALLAMFTTACMKEATPQAPKVQKNYTSDKDVLMFILDASGSMGELDKGGKVKMVAAKEMLRDISNQLDNNKTNVGLIGFSAGCQSAKLYIEPSNNDFNHVVDVSNNIQAGGKTPLAASIRRAGEVLKNIKQKINIIIISDGVETCKGNPVAEAKRLKSQYGIDAKIYVIGYSVDNNTKYQLQNLAKAGSGNYYEARDATALSTVITNITDELGIKSENWQGDTYKFKINFDSSSSVLKGKYNEQIQDFATYLKSTNYSAELQGHTDSLGKEKANKRLSQKRAQSVVNKLIAFGVPSNNVYAVGYGELAPIADNKLKEGRSENRRVEAHLIKGGKMDISYINQANSNNVIDVRKATVNSFIGYYKILDTQRTYSQYHMWMELYANEQGLFADYKSNKRASPVGKEDFSWSFNKAKGSILLDYSNKGKRATWAKFQGKITGNTNKFKLSGHWAGGKKGSVVMMRVTKEEIECIKQIGNYTNRVCTK